MSSCHTDIKERKNVSDLEAIQLKTQFVDLDNKQVDLTQYKGKRIVLNYWATWCGPCIKEMPGLKKAEEILENHNYTFLLVSDETIDKISEFKTNRSFDFNFLKSSKSIEALGIYSLRKRTVKEVVSGERDELMNTMLNQLNDSVVDLGVEIIDFRVKRIDLPSNLSNSVYERMRTERNRLAEELRSEGKEIAREIRAIADKDKVVILAEAYKKSEQLRGEGDAEATAIYAEAYSVDPEFYEFTRSLKAYTETFQNKSDVMLIDSESEFFKYLNKQSQP